MSKLIVSTLTREATFNVMVDYDQTQSTGFYRNDDSIAVRVYATGPTFTNTLIHSQEFKVQTAQELPTVRELSVFLVPEETTKLTAFCVYGSRLDNGYPENLDPEFCTDIEVEWLVEEIPPVITMDQWVYFNTTSVNVNGHTVINPPVVPTVLTGTILPAVPLTVEAYIEKDTNFYGSTYTIPVALTSGIITPDVNGNWEVSLSDVKYDTTTLLSQLKSSQHARIVVKSGDVVLEQNIYHPKIFLDSGASSIPTFGSTGTVNPIFDIGGFKDVGPSAVVNVEQNFIMLGRYMEYQYTSNYTFVEYSTPTDSVLIGPVGPTVGSVPTNYGMDWASIPKNKNYLDEVGNMVSEFNNDHTHNYAFRLNGILSGNTMNITRKYKFSYPADNIELELEMLTSDYGSIFDNNVDPLYGNVVAINNMVADDRILDINNVSATTGDTADYYVSVLAENYSNPLVDFYQPWIGSPTIGSNIFKPTHTYQLTTMGGIEYTGVPYFDRQANETEITIGRFPPEPYHIHAASPLNLTTGYISDFNYVVTKNYEYPNTASVKAPFLGGTVLIVGTPTLGTINTNVQKTYTVGLPNQLSLQTMYILGVTPTKTVQQVGAWAEGMETTVEPVVATWTGIKEVIGGHDFAAGLTEGGNVLVTSKLESSSLQLATSWSNIKHIALYGGVVGLKDDGTVLTTTTDSSISTTGWTDIVQVKADGIIVGLKSDGTMVYTGTARNYNNTADVDFSKLLTWTDIVQFDVSEQFVVGVRSDGTVVITGELRNGVSLCRNWTGIISIACGPFHVVGLKSDGTVVALGGANAVGELEVSSWSGIRQVYAGIQWSAGVKEDGTVVSTFNTTLLNDAGYDPNYTNVNSWTTNI